MSAICPNGHRSEADDYCDTCGSPIDLDAQPTAASAGTSGSAGASGGVGASGRASGSAGTTGSGGESFSAATGAPQRSSLDLDPAVPTAGEGASGLGVGTPVAPAPTGLECPNCHTENADGALFCEACGYDFTTGAMPRDAAGEAGALSDDGGDIGGDGAVGRPGGEPAGDVSEAATGGAGSAAGALAGVSAGVSAGTSAGTSARAGAGASPGAATAGSGAGTGAGAPFEWLAEVWVDPDWYQTQEAEDPCPSPGLPVIMPLRHRSVLLGRVSTSRNTHPEIDLSSDPGVSRRHAQLTSDGTRWFVEDLGSSNGTFVGQASGPLPEEPISVGPKTELDDDDRLYVGAWTRVVVRRATPDEVEAYA
ncbi:hypothetical protein GCM10027053_26850 [Intrasporangium mesophilum]